MADWIGNTSFAEKMRERWLPSRRIERFKTILCNLESVRNAAFVVARFALFIGIAAFVILYSHGIRLERDADRGVRTESGALYRTEIGSHFGSATAFDSTKAGVGAAAADTMSSDTGTTAVAQDSLGLSVE